VDVAAGDRAVELMKAAVARTHGPEVIGGIGGFAGLFDASALLGYRRPLLAASTDGVGTKIAVAQALDIHDTVGLDLVAMVVDDIVVSGAKPLFMTDYIACGRWGDRGASRSARPGRVRPGRRRGRRGGGGRPARPAPGEVR
jgi:phosphoribosylformylglycinamidine cyclo-ligase